MNMMAILTLYVNDSCYCPYTVFVVFIAFSFNALIFIVKIKKMYLFLCGVALIRESVNEYHKCNNEIYAVIIKVDILIQSNFSG